MLQVLHLQGPALNLHCGLTHRLSLPNLVRYRARSGLRLAAVWLLTRGGAERHCQLVMI